MKGLRVSLALLLAVGCRDLGESTGESSVTVRDSASIRIIDAPPSVLAGLSVRTVSAEPRLLIGVMEGPDEEMFGYIRDATRLNGGYIAIADAQQSRVLVFDRTGEYIRSIGGPGQGPGEFRSISGLAVEGDTLVVSSSRLISRFLLNGEFIDSRRVSAGIGGQMGLEYHRPVGWSVPALYWMTRDTYPRGVPEGDGPHDILLFVARADTLGGARLDTLSVAPGYWVQLTEAEMTTAQETGLGSFTVGNVTPHPLAPDVLATFVVDRLITAWTDGRELQFRDYGGVVVGLGRYGPSPGSDHDELALRDWVLSLEERGKGPLLRRAWDVLEPPEAQPLVYDLRTGAANHVWIAMGPIEVEGEGRLWSQWLRVGPDAIPIGWVWAPPVDIIELGPEGIIALQTDQLGVQRIAVYDYEGGL